LRYPKWVLRAKKELSLRMFVRRKNNRSGSTSVVVVQKIRGRCRYLNTIGFSSDENAVEALIKQGNKWIANYCGERDLFTSPPNF
jgi:hypothetical protein